MSDQLDLFDTGGSPTPPARGKRRQDGRRPPAKARVSPPSPEGPAPKSSEKLGRGATPAATSRVIRDGLAASPETRGVGGNVPSRVEAAPTPPLEYGRDLLCMTCYRVTYVIEVPELHLDPMKYKCGECLEGKYP